MTATDNEADGKDLKNDLARLRDALDGNSAPSRKQACKRVVNLMRSGENVQSLFSSVLRCVKTSDLELKKLAYLYLVSYSSHEPEQAIMAVNTFIQDSQDPNPLVRSLAVRTMCRIRLESVAEHMVIPLKKCLHDPDPYVRKTVAFGIAKLYDIIPEVVENAQLFAELLELLRDDNPMVVSNAVGAISEINERRTSPIFHFTSDTIPPLISTLNSSTDWCQAALLDALAKFTPETVEDASFFIDRLIPLLKNHNPAVIVSAFRGIFLFMGRSKRDPVELFPVVLPPFVTLVSNATYELQYVVLRTLSLFIQKYPSALTREIRVFFCKYNDPAYIKMEKLDIIMTLCSLSNAQLVLNELNEYSNAVDVAFVQKSIRCIGQIAIRMEIGAPKCLDILVGLVNGRAEYAVTEAIIVFSDILRKYPGKFESVLVSVVQNLDKIKEPRAKVAGIWILGEYCHIIERVDLLLDPYLDTFHDEPPLVQLQVLSSLVKLFLDRPDATRDQLQFALTQATRDGTVPDVRNRALVYWRLLSLDQETAKSVICFGKQTVLDSGVRFDDAVLDELIRNMGSVAGVLHIVPGDFVSRVRFVPEEEPGDDDGPVRAWSPVRLNDAHFLDVYVAFDKANIHLKIVNKGPAPIGALALAVRPNAIGLALAGTPVFPDTIDSGDIAEVPAPLRLAVADAANPEDGQLRLAIRTSAGNVFGLARIPLEIATVDAGRVSPEEFRANFASFTVSAAATVPDAELAGDGQLAERKVFVVGRNGNKAYVSFAFSPDARYLAELTQNGASFSVGLKGSSGNYLPAITQNAADFFGLK
jgi:vesicle coat complex subunit